MNYWRNVMRINRNHIWLLLPVLILAMGSVFAKQNKMKQYDITECGTVINEPGMYKVKNDLLDCPPTVPATATEPEIPGEGVVILASDVTLHLQGHTISCEQGYTAGILVGWLVEGIHNVVVRNGTVSGCDDGIVLGYTDNVTVKKMHLEDNVDTDGLDAGGITLVGATNSIIKNNTFTGNTAGIRSFSGTGNRILGNYTNGDDSAIELNYETDTIVKCNTMEQSYFGISAGPFSTGNILQGNQIIDGYAGILMYGLEFPPVPPANPEIWPVASGNMVRNNLVLGNFMDLQETIYKLATGEVYVDPNDICQNAWMSNQFGSELGPSDCIGFSVELDEDDVCALDDD